MPEQIEGKPEKGQSQTPAGSNLPVSTVLLQIPARDLDLSESPVQIQVPALNDESFWQKLWKDFWQKLESIARMAAKTVGKVIRDVIRHALTLYYALRDNDTPLWARTVISGALLYFVNPVDAIPDALPGGFTDDLAVLVAAAATVAAHIKPEHRARAQAWIDDNIGLETT